jgi:hypothetical protein
MFRITNTNYFLAVLKTVHNIIKDSNTALRSLSKYFGQFRTYSAVQSIYPARYVSADCDYERKGTDPSGRSRVRIPPRACLSVLWVLYVVRWRSPRRALYKPSGVPARLESLSTPVHNPLTKYNKFSISSFNLMM